MARPLGAAFDYSNDAGNLPNGENPEDLSRDTAFVLHAVQNCLAYSIDMLFEGDTHSARNGLASVAELITFYFGGYLSIYIPDGAPPLSKNFYDPVNNIDLWDSIYVQSSPPGEGLVKPEITGSPTVRSFTNGKTDLLSMWLNRLADIANSFDLWAVFQTDLQTTSNEFLNLLHTYDAFPEAEKKKTISDTLRASLRITPEMGTTFDEVVP